MTGSLFDAQQEAAAFYHRTHYNSGHLTPEQKNRLAKFAVQNEKAYQLLKPRESDPEACIEPPWMHRQAEHFSACLLVPKTPLLEMLNSGDDPASYPTQKKWRLLLSQQASDSNSSKKTGHYRGSCCG